MGNKDNLDSMTMKTPAVCWQDASPTGNGTIGAMLFGQIQRDTILLNHELLYYPTKPIELVDISDQLTNVRNLIEEKKYKDAIELMPRVHTEKTGLAGNSTSDFMGPYQPFCNLDIESKPNGIFKNYRRGVNFKTGRIYVEWEDDAGKTIRELFASRVDNSIHFRIKATKPNSLNYSFSCSREFNNDTNNKFFNLVNQTSNQTILKDNNWLIFNCLFEDSSSFGTISEIAAHNGIIKSADNKITVTDADEITVRIKLFVNETVDYAFKKVQDEFNNKSYNFTKSLEQHSLIQKDVYDRAFIKYLQ